MESDILENIPVGVYKLDLQGNCVFVNKRAIAAFGLDSSRHDLLGKKWMEYIYHEDFSLIEASSKMKGQNLFYEFRVTTQDPYKWLRVETVSFNNQRLGVITDITELKSKEGRIESVLQLLPIGIIRLDSNELCTFVNSCWEELSGKRRAENLGFGWITSFNSDLKKIKESKEIVNIHFNNRVIVLKFEKNESIYICVAQDITDAYEKEQSLLENSRLKSEFLANMSHEMRTPLFGITGAINLFSSVESEKEKNELLSIVSLSAESLLALINDILDISAIEQDKITLENVSFNIKKVSEKVVSVCQILQTDKNLKIINKIPDINTRGDSHRFQQILMNFVSNAVKFSKKNGIIELVTELLPKNIMRIHIKDNGIGITDSEKRKLFQPFTQVDSSVTRKYGGTGLGLYLCKKLVKLMFKDFKEEVIQDSKEEFNHIGVVSEKNQFSDFYFDIIIDLVEKVEIEDKAKNANVDIANAKILVVDDNLTNRIILTKMLTREKCIVETAENGKIAVDLVKSNDMFDLILMDCQMPVMDGYEATRKLREKEIDIPIIAITANVFKSQKNECFNSGMNYYIFKPVEKSVLMTVINKFLHKQH